MQSKAGNILDILIVSVRQFGRTRCEWMVGVRGTMLLLEVHFLLTEPHYSQKGSAIIRTVLLYIHS